MPRTMLPFKAFYFFVYAALAFVAPFLTLYYESLGLTGRQIGILAAVPSVLTFISAPIFGFVTDVTQRHKLILGISILFVAVGVFLISYIRTFLGLFPGIFLFAFFFAPVLPLVDRSVIETLGAERDQYGKQRLWGALGWGLLAPLSGYVVQIRGLQWAFYGAALLFLVLFIISQLTPIKPVEVRVNYWAGIRGLFSNFKVLTFFAVILVGGMGLASVHHYFYMYLNQLGASTVTMGYAMTIATVSELAVMYFADRLLKSWKASGLILFAMGMLVIRLLGYAFATSPQVALVLQLLHGPTFASIWMAGVAYVAEIAPHGLGNTAQGLFTGVVMGLGSALGALLGGFLYQSLGFSGMYTWVGGAVFIALLAFWWVDRRNP